MTKRCPTCGGFISDERASGIPKPKVKCPKCGSMKNWKAGTHDSIHGKIQRYQCRDCWYRFSDKQ